MYSSRKVLYSHTIYFLFFFIYLFFQSWVETEHTADKLASRLHILPTGRPIDINYILVVYITESMYYWV
jgi:hypothetical protein